MSNAPAIKRSLSKTINAPAEKTFDSWLIPAVVGRWMLGPAVQNETVVELTNNVRPGGDYHYRIKRGNREVTLQGDYRVIDRPRRLEFSWSEEAGMASIECVIQVAFATDDVRTKIKLTLVLPAAARLEADHIKGLWQTRCSALATLLNK